MKKKPKIKAKLLKRLPKKMGDDAYAYTAALLEDVNSNFRVFAENLTIVRDKVDAHHVELGRMNESFTELKIGQNLLIEDVAVLKEDVAVLKEDVSSMKQDISSLNERQDVMQADIKEIRLELKSIKNEMAELRNLLYQKADIDRLQSLEKRVSRIEETIQSRL